MLAIADATHFHLKMMVFSLVGAKRKTRWWFFVLFVTR